MPKKRILVLTDHMPWGHRSIARAIYSYIKPLEGEGGVEVFYNEVRAELGAANDIYAFICRYLPSTHRIVYKLALAATSRDVVMAELSKKSLPRLKRLIEKVKPDLIISAYFVLSHCLANWRAEEEKKFKLWTIVADPRSINPASVLALADLNLVYDEAGIDRSVDFGAEREKVLATGWWVRQEMYQTINREQARKKLGFTDNRPIIFIGGGSLGTNSITSILPSLMVVRKKVGIVFNTGIDKLGFNMVEEYVKLFKRLRRNDLVQVRNLGWIENMAEVLAGCDIVFGKAGPNFLFDVVARRLPFVAITHVGGQEDGNIDLIREKKLGWVKEKGNQAAKFLIDYVENPGRYQNKFRESLAKEAESNKRSRRIILERIKKELGL